MSTVEPIRCPVCEVIVIDDAKSLRFRVILEDIKCPRCGEIVVAASTPKY